MLIDTGSTGPGGAPGDCRGLSTLTVPSSTVYASTVTPSLRVTYRRKQQRNRAATEAARDAAGEAPWAVLVGEEWEDGQQQEPTKERDDWGLYGQAMDGDGYHPSCNLR